MNKFLADLYGTAETVGAGSSDDTEKLAEAKLLDDFFQAEGIDVDKLSDDTIVKVAYQLFGDDSAIVKEASDESEAEEEAEGPVHEKKESKDEKEEEGEEEKVAQADFLGRVMAHAFHQEKTAIEKKASAAPRAKSQPKAKEKVASPALDALAQNRALAMLKEAGYELPTEEDATEEQKLAAAIDQRALQMLKEAGYPVE
jgi:hypothetical protein